MAAPPALQPLASQRSAVQHDTEEEGGDDYDDEDEDGNDDDDDENDDDDGDRICASLNIHTHTMHICVHSYPKAI